MTYQVGDRVKYTGPHYYYNKLINHNSMDKVIGSVFTVANVTEFEGCEHVDINGFWVDIRGVEPELPPVSEEEIAELFRLKPEQAEIDWRRLFREYANAIREYEGVDFTTKIKVDWTQEEWKAIYGLLLE